ncbi:MAG: hypothetical protein M3O61_03760 [Gemmatimonadota bacterium]|nr:hypothetical protein [Gemmatimonadota bacterium]
MATWLAAATTRFEYDLGVLFVHGIGDQPRASTLVDFGTPLSEWLSERAKQVDGSMVVSSACLTPGDNEPASAELSFEGNGSRRRWLVAEAWWAESFAMRPFPEVARWTLSVVPWTFGSHFGCRLQRVLRARRHGWRGRLIWLARVSWALIALLFGVGLSLVVLVLLSGLLLLGLIPWERLRTAIRRMQVRMAATIGDSFILVSRPIEGAAILSRFSRDLEYLIARCRRVAVVAHSQGGAVAVLSLDACPIERVNLLITFGSGLRKLEEITKLRQALTVQRGAALTVAALATVTVAAALLVRMVVERRDLASGDVLIFAGFATVGMALLIAGISDFVSRPDLPRLQELARRFHDRGITWNDLYASADPVPNGPLHDDDAVLPDSIEVVNGASMLSDHTGYWRNRDEFVTLVSEALLKFDDPPIMPLLEPATIAYLRRRRRVRVMMLRLIIWVAAASIAALFVQYRDDWAATLAWIARFFADRIAALLGTNVMLGPSPEAAVWGSSVGWLSLILLALFWARGMWSKWESRETEKPPPYQYRGGMPVIVSVSVWFQLVSIGVAWNRGQLPGWLVPVTLVVAVCLVMPHAMLRDPPEVRVAGPPPSEKQSRAVATATAFYKLLNVGAMLLGTVLFAGFLFRGARWILVSGLGVSNPSAILVIAVIAAGLGILFLLLLGVSWLVSRRGQTETGPVTGR